MSAVLPARPLEAKGAALTQQQHQQLQQHSQPLSSNPASPPPPPLPSRNLRRTSRFLDVLLDTTKSAPTVVTATLATATTHDVYLSSEEDASSFSSDMSDYNSDEEMDDDNDACSSSTSMQTTTRNSSCDGGASLRTPSPSSTQHEAVAAPPSPPSAARRRSRDATARAVSVVFAGKPSLVDLVLERETRRRSVPSLRAAAAAAAAETPTDSRSGSRKDPSRSLRIITEDLPSRLSTASPISRPASASPYMASSSTSTPTLTPRSSLLFRGVSRTLTLSRRLGRSSRRDETRDDASEGRDAATPLTHSASSALPPHRAPTPLSAIFFSSPFPSSFDEDEQQQQQKRRRKTDAHTADEGPSSSSSNSDSSRPSSAYIRSIPRSQTASILATPALGPLASRKENAEGGGRFLGNFSGRRRSLKLL